MIMDKNPVYEICDIPPNFSSDRKKDLLPQPNSPVVTSEKKITERKISVRVYVAGILATVALLALLVLVGAVLSIAMQRTNISIPSTEESSTELKSVFENFVQNLTAQFNEIKRANTINTMQIKNFATERENLTLQINGLKKVDEMLFGHLNDTQSKILIFSIACSHCNRIQLYTI